MWKGVGCMKWRRWVCTVYDVDREVELYLHENYTGMRVELEMKLKLGMKPEFESWMLRAIRAETGAVI